MEESGQSLQGQESAFCIQEENGFSLHYATYQITVKGKRQENWSCIYFKTDFIETLSKYNRLPIANYKRQLSTIAERDEEIAKLKKSTV